MKSTVVRLGEVWCSLQRSGLGWTAGGTPAVACLPRERTVAERYGPLPGLRAPRPRGLRRPRWQSGEDPNEALARLRQGTCLPGLLVAETVVRLVPGPHRPEDARPAIGYDPVGRLLAVPGCPPHLVEGQHPSGPRPALGRLQHTGPRELHEGLMQGLVAGLAT